MVNFDFNFFFGGAPIRASGKNSKNLKVEQKKSLKVFNILLKLKNSDIFEKLIVLAVKKMSKIIEFEENWTKIWPNQNKVCSLKNMLLMIVLGFFEESI